MAITQSKPIATVLFFLFIFISGIWLSKSGRPLNSAILTIHKLIAVAALVFLVMSVFRMKQDVPLNTIELTVTVITGLLFISTIITGGLLSINDTMPASVLTMHQVLPILTTLSTAISLYLLLNRR